jgi:general secretion pathway protein K
MRSCKSKGFVLVVVLGAVIALCAILLAFTERARTSLAQADGFYRAEQAFHSAWAGLQIAVALVRDANETGADLSAQKLLTQENTFTLADANCTFALTAENGLLNINRLVTSDGRPDRPHIEQFLRLIDALNRERKDAPPIGYGLAAALVDWLDPDNDVVCLPFVQHDNLGAESDYYQTRRPPYPCRNAPVHTLEELLPVKGMTPELLERLRPLLTCVGDGKIDLNAAPPLVLQSLAEQLDAPLAELIVRQRQGAPFKDLADLRTLPGMTDNIYRDLQSLGTLKPQERFYRVRARGNRETQRVTLEALLRKNRQTQTVDILLYREL